jgi:hypothetical protein
MVYIDTDVSEEAVVSIFSVQLEYGGIRSLLNAANNIPDYTEVDSRISNPARQLIM